MKAPRDAGAGKITVDGMSAVRGTNYAVKAALLDRFARKVMAEAKER